MTDIAQPRSEIKPVPEGEERAPRSCGVYVDRNGRHVFVCIGGRLVECGHICAHCGAMPAGEECRLTLALSKNARPARSI